MLFKKIDFVHDNRYPLFVVIYIALIDVKVGFLICIGPLNFRGIHVRERSTTMFVSMTNKSCIHYFHEGLACIKHSAINQFEAINVVSKHAISEH